jgi:hypothetical protein
MSEWSAGATQAGADEWIRTHDLLLQVRQQLNPGWLQNMGLSGAKEPNGLRRYGYMEMVETQAEQSGWLDWLQHDESLVPEGAEDLVVTSVRVLQLNGRFLYLKRTTDLADFNAGERLILEALSRQGDTVFVAVGPDPGHVRLSYRMPDLENAVAFDPDGLRGLIRQWFVWASTTESTSA